MKGGKIPQNTPDQGPEGIVVVNKELMLAVLAFASLVNATGPATPLWTPPLAQQSGAPDSKGLQAKDWPAPSDAEIKARAQKLISNQHRNDKALDEYERVEHQVSQTGGDYPRVLEDRTFRVVPTGSGTMKLLLKADGKSSDPADYRKQLQAWADVLSLMLKTEDPRTKTAVAKWQKRQQERAELVDASPQAFSLNWVGIETRNGRRCDVLDLQPNPNFHPHSILQEAISHVVAKIWIDHEADQMVRAEARLLKDVSFGGGILGKLYRGGVFSLEQAEVSPGLWLPSRYQYDFTARKFLFTFEEHQYIEASQYHWDGPPKQALAIAQNELATGKMAYGAQ
jgi:hypothetical protein